MKNWLTICAVVELAFVFVTPGQTPVLNVEVGTDSKVRLSWSSSATGYALEQADELNASTQWSSTPVSPQLIGQQFSIAVDDNAATRFFRLANRTADGLPDPATVAPPIETGVVTLLSAATDFLHLGAAPTQTGVAAGTIETQRAAVVRGKVLNRDSTPLPDVTISILNHPEFGTTRSRADGMFDLVVNGGGLLIVKYEKTDYCPVQRQLPVPWQNYVKTPEVVMIRMDPVVTAVAFGANSPMQVHEGSVQSDAAGSRKATLLFTPGTIANLMLANGSTQAITALHVRATEFTVGPNGPAAMPGVLPPTSGYTYCAELSADEAMAADAPEIHFDRPVCFYVENFRHFPVGAAVPVGFYDRKKGVWQASTNGIVIKIVSITGGLAEIDSTGQGAPDNSSRLASLGITDAERQQLATLFPAGQTLWRTCITHFTPWDTNWPLGFPVDAISPGLAGAGANRTDVPLEAACIAAPASVIECENQVLGEAETIVGTPYTLNYRSDRVPDRSGARELQVSLGGTNLPASLKRIELEVRVAGEVHRETFPPAPNQGTLFEWDGRDAYARSLQGSQLATIDISYVYGAEYTQANPVPASFGLAGSVAIASDRTDLEISATQSSVVPIGGFDARAIGLGGWTLSIHHYYDPNARELHLGNGQRRLVAALPAVIHQATPLDATGFPSLVGAEFVAAGPDGSIYFSTSQPQGPLQRITPDGRLVDFAPSLVGRFEGLAVGSDGNVYVAVSFRNNQTDSRVLRVAPDETVTPFAGTGEHGASGDGGPAIQATLKTPFALAVGPDGSVYICDEGDHRIRRVGTDGIITTVAGTGQQGSPLAPNGDGGPATNARLNAPEGVAVGPDGSLYISDTNSGRVRHVRLDGTIETVAGNGTFCNQGPCGDGLQAVQASVYPHGIGVGLDGTIYFIDTPSRGSRNTGQRLRAIGPDGIIRTAGGRGDFSGPTPSHVPTPATQVSLGGPQDVAVSPDGTLYISDGLRGLGVLLHVEPALRGLAINDFLVASPGGSELYEFDPSGRHRRTMDGLTGASLYEFSYDVGGRLNKVVEKTGGTDNITTIQHDANGNPTLIQGPFGQQTKLGVDGNGFLTAITNAAGEHTAFTSTSGGLLSSRTDPRGNSSHYRYDTLGRLIHDADAINGVQDIVRTDTTNRSSIGRSTALGRTTTYTTENLPGKVQRRTVTAPDATQYTSTETIDAATTHFTAPDGTVSTVTLRPDPRFGMESPITKIVSIRMPSSLQLAITNTRSAFLSDPLDPLSISSQTDTITFDGQMSTIDYDPGTKTYTGVSANGRIRKLTTDSLGRLIQTEVDGLNPEHFAYDSRGRLSNFIRGELTEARTNSFTYNAQGFLETITDPLGRLSSFDYDAAGRLISRTLADGRVIGINRDANGNVTTFTPPGRPAYAFEYSARNELTNVIPPQAAAAGPTAYTYDADRVLTTVSHPDNRVTAIGYDAAGREIIRTLITNGITTAIENQSFDAAGRVTNRMAASGVASSYAYDGPLLTLESWSGPIFGSVMRRYDTSLRLAAQSVNGTNAVIFTYDHDGLLTQIDNVAITRDVQHGRVAGATLGIVNSAISYNGFGEVTNYVANANNTPLYKLATVRDRLGRPAQNIETVGGTTIAYYYTYDSVGELIQVSSNGVAIEQYAYDLNYNRTNSSVSGINSVATYDNQDRLQQSGKTVYTYNGAGQLAMAQEGANTTIYRYDQFGNLLEVTLPDGKVINYIIDSLDRRVGKKLNGNLVSGFLYGDALRPVAELDSTGALISRFVYAGKNVPIYLIKGGVTWRIITDQVGSVRLVVDSSTGAIVQRIDYDSFGNVLLDTNPGFQPFGFAGGLYDTDTKLVRFGRRDYDATTGRWTAQDPAGFAGGSPNLYAYVGNRPVGAQDSKGLDPDDGVCEAFAPRTVRAYHDPSNQSREGEYAGVVTFAEGIHKGIGIVFTDGRVVRFDKKCGESGAIMGFSAGCVLGASADIIRLEYPSLTIAYAEGEVIYGPMDQQSTQSVDEWLEGQYENQNEGKYDVFFNSCRDLVNDALAAARSGGFF